MRHPERYTESERYSLAQFVVNNIRRKGNVCVRYSGLDNLPKDNGYILYPNHQGRFDAVAIISCHKNPLTFVMDSIRSRVIVMDEITTLLGGKRLNKSDIRNQVKTILEVADEVASGRNYIIFPEGGYATEVHDNEVHPFMAGAFKAAVKSKCPIVPVALIDSYKVYEKHSLKKVYCEVHYLPPITYDEYKDMNTFEISDLVKSRIESKIKEALAI